MSQSLKWLAIAYFLVYFEKKIVASWYLLACRGKVVGRSEEKIYFWSRLVYTTCLSSIKAWRVYLCLCVHFWVILASGTGGSPLNIFVFVFVIFFCSTGHHSGVKGHKSPEVLYVYGNVYLRVCRTLVEWPIELSWDTQYLRKRITYKSVGRCEKCSSQPN